RTPGCTGPASTTTAGAYAWWWMPPADRWTTPRSPSLAAERSSRGAKARRPHHGDPVSSPRFPMTPAPVLLAAACALLLSACGGGDEHAPAATPSTPAATTPPAPPQPVVDDKVD